MTRQPPHSKEAIPFLVRISRSATLVATVLALAACATSPQDHKPTRAGATGNGGYYKVGQPYQINGIWYYPSVDYSYDETGIASWYGPGFHQETTANGEVFDQNELTGAHKTLPMPSLVRVTNLDNGRSIVLRVNDRGPFVGNRVIDVSRRAAQLLGFEQTGTAKVRVTILADESRAIAAAAQSNQTSQVARAELGPLPQAAPRVAVQVEGLPPPPAPVQRPPVEPPRNVPGETVEGRFLPAPVVQQQPVAGARQIYVQAGAFTLADNANRVRAKLSGLGQARVTQANVGGTQYFRVRLGPIETVEQADALLAQVVGTGVDAAKIIVD